MKGKSSLLITLSLLLVLGLGVGAFSLWAKEPAPPRRPLAEPVGSAFTYQGRLMDGGNPANGAYDFQFELYDAATMGSQVGPTVNVDDHPVTDGLFTVGLDFGSVFDGTALWLEIGVRPGASIDPYTILDPRQELTATPYALYALSIPLAGSGSATTAARSDHNHDTTYQAKYVRTVVVSPVGTAAENGSALLNALAGITDASGTNPYLLKIEPGVYDLGTSALSMKEYVDIEGSGELVTTIRASGSTSFPTGTVVGADSAELRFLTVENTGGNTWAVAICNSSTWLRLTHVTAKAWGATHNYGVYNNSSSTTMTNIETNASAGTYNYAVYNNDSSTTMINIEANAWGGTYNYGVYNNEFSGWMTNVTASASGGTYNRGVYNNSSWTVMTNVTAQAAGGSITNRGIDNYAPSGSYTVKVNNSRIVGSTNTIVNDPHFITLVGASLLDGGTVNVNGGTVTCAGVYDESYTFYASTCP